MKKVLLAGATGYLGRYILDELMSQNIQTRILVRDLEKVKINVRDSENVESIKAEVTNPQTLENLCDGVDTLISTVGITRQKDGLSYMDVDYQANMNLLNEAKRSGVKKFIYISVLNGENLQNVQICFAKERFVSALKKSGIDYCVVRPNGFFSDMAEFYNMAKNGTIYLFGNGLLKSNPIHGKDLAVECVKSIDSRVKEFNIGGPQTLTQNEVAEIAFQVVGKKPKIIHISDWIRRITLTMARIIMSKQKFGPFEFFMTVMSIEMVAPEFGENTLKRYFEELNL